MLLSFVIHLEIYNFFLAQKDFTKFTISFTMINSRNTGKTSKKRGPWLNMNVDNTISGEPGFIVYICLVRLIHQSLISTYFRVARHTLLA